MCIFKRIVYDQCLDSKPYGPDPVRKCLLQLAYEHGETHYPCGRIAEHSYMSIKVGGRCRDCEAKLARSSGMLTRFKDQLAQAKGLLLKIPETTTTTTKISTPGALSGAIGDDDETGHDEAMSPVALTFDTVVLGVPVSLSSPV